MESISVKLGLVASPDALALWLAEEMEFFAAQNVTMELVPFQSAPERDAALKSGQVDGVLTDLVAAAQLVESGVKAKVVSVVRGAAPQEGTVGIVAISGSGISQASELVGKKVAGARDTVLHYAFDRLLEAKGVKPEGVTLTDLTDDEARYDALMAGTIAVAILPEPYLSFAVNRGAKLLGSEAEGEQSYSQSVLLFTEEILAHGEGMKNLFIAYNRAVAGIQLEPGAEAHFDLLMAKSDLPVFIKVVYDQGMPFSMAAAPSKESVAQVMEWMVAKQIVAKKLAYEQLVNSSVLPR